MKSGFLSIELENLNNCLKNLDGRRKKKGWRKERKREGNVEGMRKGGKKIL